MLRELFGVTKPVIAMAHLPALPGTPRYDPALGVDGMVERVRADLRHLLAGGVDAVMFCNEDDRPYSLRAGLESVSVMTRVVTELRPSDRPFGVDFLWDPMAPMAIAKATGAAFIREVVTGVYESDMGLWAPDAAELYRYRARIDAQSVRVLANITPEFASPLGSRSVADRARSAAVSSLVDAILIAGPMAGAAPERSAIEEAKAAVGDAVPVLLNTGARAETIADFLTVADGVIVGSSLKVDGKTWNPVDPARVRAFMDAVRGARR
ncbi:MAG: BtpA/SgcQ family protein [Ectothiorhodospiraceae bacterium]|nr:BtpA/SgcQ family protein [Ectothiorhodospiraceae bacterium]